MLINEIVLVEEYYSDLILAVQDLMTRYMSKDIKEISTEKFRQRLAKQGYVTTISELIQAVDQSGFAVSVDAEKIVPQGQLPAAMTNDSETDVGDMAGNQAMQDIKADL
jgi:hypothetical protein